MSHLQEHSNTRTSTTVRDNPTQTAPRMKPNHAHRHSRDVSASAAAALGWSRHMSPPNKPATATATANSLSPSAARAATLAARSPSPRRQDGQRGRAPSTGATSNTLQSGTPQDWGNSAAAHAFKGKPARAAESGPREEKSHSLLAAQASKIRPARSAEAEPRDERSHSLLAAQASKRRPARATEAEPRDERSHSLLAARGAVSAARPRSLSSPVLKQPTSEQPRGNGNDAKHDTTTHRWEFEPERKSVDDSAVLSSTISPLMYTANPPVALEVEEKRKEEELHASAVAMAKTMFNNQSKLTESFLHEDDDMQSTSPSGPTEQHPNLHEAAYKLAQERLAKLSDEHQKNRGFRDHYVPPAAVPRRRFTVSGRLRKRSSSDGDDEGRWKNRLSNRTSLTATDRAEADAMERERDRAKVLAAAQRNVRSQLDGIDKSVADRTGMMPPSTKGVWASRAQAIAQAKAAAAAAPEGPHEGERNVGGGRYVAQDEIEAVARENLKPLLLEIDERAEKERERQRVQKEEMEAKKAEAAKKEAYDKEVKDNLRKLKAEQKEKEKERLKVIKEEERAKKKEEKARRKAEKEAHSKDAAAAAAVGADDTRAGAMSPDSVATEQETSPQGAHGNGILRRATPPIPLKTSETEPKEHTQSPGKVKNWLRAKLTRQKPREDQKPRENQKPREDTEQPRSFVGGHGLRSPETSTGSTVPAPSARDVDSLARRIRHPHLEEERARTPSLSGREEGERPDTGRRVSSGTEDMFEDARDGLSPPMTPPPRMVGAAAGGNPNRDSRFVEIMD